MTVQRQEHLHEIMEWMVRLESWIHANSLLQHHDANIELESFFRDLLNFTNGWQLENANHLLGRNQDSFDLADVDARIAVQVTSTTTPAKIKKTLKTFVGKHDSSYDRLIFVYPTIAMTNSRANFTRELGGFPFDVNRDRLCLGSVLTQAQSMGIDRQSGLLELLRKELRPLGVPLQMGIDQTIETLIAVIEFMSRTSPTHSIALDELKPDQAAKLARLGSHSEFLIRQFRMNQTLHATIAQARDAIGYDAVRAVKIQTWLKVRSLDLLDSNDNDATAAFKEMVADLLRQAHSGGTDAEETAVRFLLADEFIRCNVFPNPETLL